MELRLPAVFALPSGACEVQAAHDAEAVASLPPHGRRLMNCVLIAMGLYSSISMLLALFALEANSDDISNSFDNWVSRPRAPLPAPGAR